MTITKRDLSKIKPSALNVFGIEIDPETIAAIYADLGHINEIYETQAASFYTAYAAFTLDDIEARVRWSFDTTKKARALEGASDVILWLTMFKPFNNDEPPTFMWNRNEADKRTNVLSDIELARRLSLYVYRIPVAEVYTGLLKRDAQNGTHDAQDYLDWSIFMALTASSTELATYGTRSFPLDS